MARAMCWRRRHRKSRLSGKIDLYYTSMNTEILDKARQLSLEEQLELVEALWDNIVERNAVPGLSAAQKAELDRRLAEHEENPDDVVPWHEVKAAALTQINR